MECLDTRGSPLLGQSGRGYRRREPENTLLYTIVSEHLESFLERAAQLGEGAGLPRFVERELRAYVQCGILEHGFVRVHCHSCGKDAVVAFSCKGREFCPSCGGRRMADTAAHLVDRVLPDVPVRQWVLSLPIRLRYLIAFDRELCRRVRNIFLRAVLGWMKRRGFRDGMLDSQAGAVTAVQRFGSALNLNMHFHSLVLDGVFHSTDGRDSRFLPLPSPTREELGRLLARIRSRILSLLRRSGLAPADYHLGMDPLSADSATLAACAQASLRRRVAMGPTCGQPIPRWRDPDRALPYRFPKEGCVDAQGFSLHADVRIDAGCRDQLERLCRYLLRPPVSDDRLSLTGDGRIALELKTPYDDGTTHFLFDAMTFLERLAALVPPPRAHLIVYHGVLAPAAALRGEIVPRTSPISPAENADEPPDEEPPASKPEEAPNPPRNYTWAELMRRVFAIDVLQCDNCGGRRSLIAVITEPPVVARILESLDLSSSARSPPLTLVADSQHETETRFIPDAS